MICAVALSRCLIASLAFAYLFAPCNALDANMFEPINIPIVKLQSHSNILYAPTDKITMVINPIKNISKFAVLSCCRFKFTLCAVSTIIIIIKTEAITAAVQFMNNKAIRNINTKGQSNIHPVILELVAPLITAPAFSSALNSVSYTHLTLPTMMSG